MAAVEVKNFESPDETRPFEGKGQADVVQLAGHPVARAVFEPGWKWSTNLKPIAGTESCMTRHKGICLSGQMTIRADDGTEATIGAGDVFLLEPGHDAWTVGDESCVLFDTGIAAYAKPAP